MSSIDMLWLVISALLVALMQPGFTALEAGIARSKNSISTAIKNLSDFLISFLVFVTLGAGILLGNSYEGLWGQTGGFFYLGQPDIMVQVLFQAMFASTAVTIISGAIAERAKFTTYLIIAVIVSVCIYPFQAHWAWNAQGWLAQIGFIDFAGSTIVHSVGGWAALAAVILIGPRLGRFDQDQPTDFEPANLAYSALGVFLIWLGWIGFNGGSVLAWESDVLPVILNTMLAGVSGGLSSLILGYRRYGYFHVVDLINGVLAGLVAITAGAHLASPEAALAIGVLGYLAYWLGKTLLEAARIDDVIEAIPVHLFAGIAGTLAVAFLTETPFEQFWIQLLGVASIGAFVFGITWSLLSLINRFWSLRLTHNDEILGLNISEHRARTSMLELVTRMNEQARKQDFSRKIVVEPFSDAAVIANFYNQVTQAFNQLSSEKETLIQESLYIANYDQLTGLAKRRPLLLELEHCLTPETENDHHANHALLYLDLDGFKAVNDQLGHQAGDELLKQAAQRIQSTIDHDHLASRFGGDEFVILLKHIPSETFVAQVAQALVDNLHKPYQLDQQYTDQVSASLGMVIFHCGEAKVDALLQRADKAMYAAKKRGKNQWVTG
ncbi:ammonium transporter [Thiomicrospira sp. WB1]|uniref:ammonium transporter n=1 Tax=Thiomicrospira sp. WB1 TaxID=1685380 RepID=UPI000746095A|nr:ammonium transporter [Thiomicrospira sp. WB1]KUJ71339.1 ammonium transporter [Thiomicrospira sp. WB1]